MSFWEDLAEVGVRTLVAMASIQKISEWQRTREEKGRDEMADEIARWLRYATRDEVRLVREGFEHCAVSIQDLKKMRQLLVMNDIFCVEAFKASS